MNLFRRVRHRVKRLEDGEEMSDDEEADNAIDAMGENLRESLEQLEEGPPGASIPKKQIPEFAVDEAGYPTLPNPQNVSSFYSDGPTAIRYFRAAMTIVYCTPLQPLLVCDE